MSLQSHHFLDPKSLKHEIDAAEAWNWRARTQVIMDLRDQIVQEAKGKDKASPSAESTTEHESVVDRIMGEKRIPQSLRGMVKSLDQVLKTATARAFEKSLIEEAIDDDFGIVVELKPEEMPPANPDAEREMAIPYAKL